jgi:hypothetical protein
MHNEFRGLDVLRGLGLFVLVTMHTAFYHFSGLYDLDLDNPPLIVTMIGFLLMFAGMFAMISGLVHTFQNERKLHEHQLAPKKVLRYVLAYFAGMMIIAYAYFLFTGPGIVNMALRSMDESVIVHWINTGTLIVPSLDRILYIDSLVMIGMNVLLVGGLVVAFRKIDSARIKANISLIGGVVFFAVSLIRIPLYNIYLEARDALNWPVILALNWIVNKNNPILPYLAFALFGMWMAYLLIDRDRKFNLKTSVVGSVLFVAGITAYIVLPETMLQRQIDPVWFAIMMAQIGLFVLMIAGFLRFHDFHGRTPGRISRFFSRFSKGGLTVFFVESVVSAAFMAILRGFGLTINLDIPMALAYGLLLALGWGGLLILWEKAHYRYGIEYILSRWLAHLAPSSKKAKLER